MTKETPTVLALGIHKLSSLGEDGWTLTDGHTVLLCSSSAGDGTPELAVLVLESFTCYHFSSKELEESEWLKAIDRATHGAFHSGLTILVSNEGGFSSLSSFSIDPSKELLRQTSSPALPDGISLSAISIDGQYICIARKGSDENYQWEILVLDRATYQNIATLSGPVVKAEDGGDNHVQDIFIRKTCIVAVTTRGHLFYWNEEFVAIPDQSPNRIDDLLSDERRIDTVCLSQDLKRVVMMDLIAADDVAMILCKQPCRIPADSRRTSRSRYLRIDADCQTVVRGSMTNDGNKIITPRFDIYPISEAEPWATIEPISASFEADIGPFIDVWVNKISLTYFGEKGAIQVRFDGNNKTTSRRDGNLTSSRYMPLSYDCWNAVNQSNDEHRDNVQVKTTATRMQSNPTSKYVVDMDLQLRPRKQRAEGPGVEVELDPDNLMDNWLLSSRKLKMERTSQKEFKRNAWIARKALDPPYAGIWRFNTNNSNERTFVKPQAHDLDNQFDQGTNPITFRDTINGNFFDGERNRQVLYIYQQFWLRGDKQGFFNKLHQHLCFKSNSETSQDDTIPEESVWKVFRCLIGALVPVDSNALKRTDNGDPELVKKERRTESGEQIRTVGIERSANEIDGFPKHVVAGPDTIWQVGKCMLQILTRGRFWDDESNVLNPVDHNEKFGVYKQTVLQQKYSKNLIKHILACLTRLPENRPTQDDLLQHFHTIFSVYDGTYQPKPVNEGSRLPYQPKDPRIPTGLTREEGAVYETFLKVVDDRSFETSKDSINRVPSVFMISDIAKDVDDFAAWILGTELNRLKVIRLKGFVANLMPARKRALLGRGALDHLGLRDIEVGEGSVGDVTRVLGEQSHEFHKSKAFSADENTVLPDGQSLLRKAFSEAAESNEKLTLVLISSLMDISIFAKTDPEILKNGLSDVVLQGGYRFIDGVLTPDLSAQNNKFDPDSATEFHEFMQKNQIKSAAWSKVVALKVPISDTLFKMLGDSQNPLGEYLCEAQKRQDQNFSKPCFGPKEKRYAPYMTKEWLIAEKTNWFAAGHEPDEGYPEGDDLTPFFTKAVMYDPIAVLGSAGKDALVALGLLRRIIRRTDAKHSVHLSFGILPIPRSDNELGKPEEANLNCEKTGIVVTALTKGKFLALQQGI